MPTSIDYDNALTILLQRNLCLVCHMPLCVNAQIDVWHTNANFLWIYMHQHMRWDQRNRALTYDINQLNTDPSLANSFYGTRAAQGGQALRRFYEKCHLINQTMTMEIYPLYHTENVGTTVYPLAIQRDSLLYYDLNVHPNTCVHQFTLTQLQAMLEPDTDDRLYLRLANLAEKMGMTGTRYFIACSNCNTAHTGEGGVRKVFTTKYGNINDDLPTSSIVYTMIFDCMAAGKSNAIMVQDVRQHTMLPVLKWLNYLCLMLLAQFAADPPDPVKFSASVHTRIGVQDFYASQLICTLLYMNFDIDYPFWFLHQTCVAWLAYWAEKSGNGQHMLPATVELWRLMLGDAVGANDEWLCAIDVVLTPGSVPAVQWANLDIPQKLGVFYRRWVRPLGHILANKPITSQLPAIVQVKYNRLRLFVNRRTTVHVFNGLKSWCRPELVRTFAENQYSIELLKRIWNFQDSRIIRWENTACLCIPRIRYYNLRVIAGIANGLQQNLCRQHLYMFLACIVRMTE